MPRTAGNDAREVVVQFDDGTEELVLCNLTSDEATIEFAKDLAHQHAGYHEAVRLGYTLPPAQRPAMAVLARNLSEAPHHKAFYPGAINALRHLRVRVPPAPEVYDYRTAKARGLRDERQRRGHPWDLPRVKALAARFNWPAP